MIINHWSHRGFKTTSVSDSTAEPDVKDMLFHTQQEPRYVICQLIDILIDCSTQPRKIISDFFRLYYELRYLLIQIQMFN
jgi:hypothetical protein